MALSATFATQRLDTAIPLAFGTVEPKARLSLVIEYDGGRYAGSQWQPDVPTVQSEIEKALLSLTGESIRITLAGRTDAGVHAKGQRVAFDTSSTLSERAFVSGMNHFLPSDIAVKEARLENAGFDPRRHACRREYEYFILNSNTRSPLWNGRAYRVAGGLDVEAMDLACQMLLGEHDFASFASSMENDDRTTVRYMYHASVRRDNVLVVVRMVASAFLLHQVRNTVGALVRIGQGKMTLSVFQGIINAREFGLAGPTAPSYGLYLNRVSYDNIEEGF